MLALITGAFVASPALPEPANNGGLIFTLVAGGLLVYLLQKASGDRAGAGRKAGAAVWIVGVLAMLSVNFGITAADANIWSILPALVAFALTLGMTRALYSAHAQG